MMLRRSLGATLIALLLTALCARADQAAASHTAPAKATQELTKKVNDGLDLRFANGIAAIVEDTPITVDDIRREIAPLIPQLQRESHNEQEFDQKLQALQDEVIQNLIDRVLIVKAFKKKKDDSDEVRKVPASYIDNRIEEIQNDQFDGDRSKFLAYLRSRGMTMKDYRKEVEDDIIYNYMLGQQRKSASIVSPVKIEQYYNENKDRFYQEDAVKMGMIQINRNPGETDQQLIDRGNELIARFKAGTSFEDLAKTYSQDAHRLRGGDWGWQKRTDLKKEFATPLFALKKGQVTDPIITPEGCFILYVEDRKYAGIQPIDDVRDQIEHILAQQMSQRSRERWLERLRRDGYVKHY